MSLTAHPYVVLAEQQWKQDNLGGANRAPHRAPRGQHRTRAALRRVAAALHTPRHTPQRGGRHTARPV